MSSDFFLLGSKPTSIGLSADVAPYIEAHVDPKKSITSKVVLVPLFQISEGYLKSIKPENFSSCIFIYIKEQGQDLNKWYNLYNHLPPLQILSPQQITKKLLENTSLILREREQKALSLIHI